MATYFWMKHLHLLTVTISILMFMLRFFWKCSGSAMLQKRWVRILPHLNDTILFISGIVLVFITHMYPFTPQGAWLTEKLFGVIIYILLGYVALGKRERSVNLRWLAFLLALGCFYLVIRLATTKLPLLMG